MNALAASAVRHHLGTMATYRIPSFDFARTQTRSERIARLDTLASLLDVAFVVPGTNIRFGIEAIIRLVPGIGDLAASALSCFVLYEAHQIGVPAAVLARMIANVAVEGVIGAVPFVGDAFDVAFRANRRNVSILREWAAREGIIAA